MKAINQVMTRLVVQKWAIDVITDTETTNIDVFDKTLALVIYTELLDLTVTINNLMDTLNDGDCIYFDEYDLDRRTIDDVVKEAVNKQIVNQISDSGMYLVDYAKALMYLSTKSFVLFYKPGAI